MKFRVIVEVEGIAGTVRSIKQIENSVPEEDDVAAALSELSDDSMGVILAVDSMRAKAMSDYVKRFESQPSGKQIVFEPPRTSNVEVKQGGGGLP